MDSTFMNFNSQRAIQALKSILNKKEVVPWHVNCKIIQMIQTLIFKDPVFAGIRSEAERVRLCALMSTRKFTTERRS